MEQILVTLNPNDMGSGFTLSNGNLTFVSATDYRAIRATHGKSYGKWYWEVRYDAGVKNVHIGISNKDFSLVGNFVPDSTNWRTYYGNSGNKYPENTTYSTTWDIGNIIGVALDLDNGTLEFYKNGVSMGISHTNIKLLGEVYPTLGSFSGSSKTATINFGATPFIYNIPNGFMAYNLVYSYKMLLSSLNKYYSLPERKISTINAIPAMTSNNSPSGLVSASSQYSATTYYPYLAFNQTNLSNTDCWVSAAGMTDAWIQYSFQNPQIISSYTITNRNNGTTYDSTPKNWILKASNDEINWDILDERNNIPSWTSVETRKYDCNNDKSYKHYRIHVTSVHSGSYMAIGKIEMFELINTGSTLFKLESVNEDKFIKYGTDKSPFNNKISSEKSIKYSSNTLNSGKTFEHTIDMSKRKINQIIFG